MAGIHCCSGCGTSLQLCLSFDPGTSVCCRYDCEGKKKKELEGAPIVALWVKNLTSIHEEVGSIPDLSQWVKDPMLLHAGM